jgi:pyruvate kinase
LAEVRVGGVLSDHKGVAFPDSKLSLESVTSKDEADLAFGRELGVDYVAASFVRSGDDVRRVAALAGDIPIIAKIELAQAYENLDDIIGPSFGLMVARGDLGVQLPLERIPLIQDEILKKTNAAGRVSITATEMLESMTKSPRPTRAEVTDVAHAVMAGTDAVMLSGETAVGDYPVETVAAMAAICVAMEEGTLSDEVTLRRMALYWGVTPHRFERRTYTDEELAAAASILEAEGAAANGDRVVMVAGVPPNQRASTNLVKVHVIGELSGGLGS